MNIITAYRASRMKQDAFAARHPIDNPVGMHPGIGTITRGKGKRLYYAFLHGYDHPETFGTIAELTALLEALN